MHSAKIITTSRAPVQNGHNVRDRVLLYLTGMGMNDVASLELAAECLRQAGPGASAGTAMAILRELLAERNLGLRSFEPGVRLASFPPLIRKPMISSWTARPTFYASAKKLALRIIGGGSGRTTTPPRDSQRKGA